MTETNFQNLFPAYASTASYNVVLDTELKVDENPNLIPGSTNTNPSVNPGAWQYSPVQNGTTAYTIGYGYDFSTKTGLQIESDFSSANLTLPSAAISDLNNYTVALATAQATYTRNPTNANQQQLAASQNELNAVSADMAGVVLTDAQATALMQPAIAVATSSVQATLANASGNSTDLALATGNDGLHALLVNEDYNGGSLFGRNQLTYLEADNVDAFVEDVLFNNNRTGGVYSQGVENRRVKDFAASLGLTAPTETTGSPDIVEALVFGTNVIAAAYLYSTLASLQSAITTQINSLGATAQANLSNFVCNTIANAQSTLQAAGLYGVSAADMSAASAAGQDIWAYLAGKLSVGSVVFSAQALQAINGKFLSTAGSVVAFSGASPDANIGAGAVIHTATQVVSGFPAISTIQSLDQQHAMLYDLNTNRTYTTAGDVDGSDAGLFEIVDDSGDVLYSAAASGVTGITESLATSFDPAVIQVTAGGQTSQIAAGTHYDVQPGDTWTLLAPELSAASGNSMDTDLLESVNGGLSAAPVVGTDLRIPAVTFESFQTQPDVASSIYEGGSNPNLDLVLDVNSMSQSYTAALPGGTDGNRILVIDDAGHLLATAPLTDNFTVNYDINDGGPTSLVLAGVTYTPGTGNGTVAQTAGGDTVSGAVTVDPSTTGSGVTVADSAGSGTVTFDDAASGTGDPDFWTVGSGTDTATLQAGTAVVDFTGGQSQYAVSYTASSQTLAVTDGVAGRNGAKTLTAAGGSAKLFFALNQPGESELELGTQVEGDDATTKGALFSEGALLPVTVDGQLTDELTDTAAGSGYIIGATSGETDDIANGSTASNAPSGTIAFADEPMPVTESHSQLWLTKSANGHDLLIDVLGTTEQVDVANWFASGDAYAQVATILASDGTLANAQVAGLVSAMAA